MTCAITRICRQRGLGHDSNSLVSGPACTCSARNDRPRGRLALPGQGVQVLLRRCYHRAAAAGPGPPVRRENGIYIPGDKSWSIDMQRHNFQFTGQRFYKIEHGRLGGELRDVAYQAATTGFWNSI
jgi:hypothetical protein